MIQTLFESEKASTASMNRKKEIFLSISLQEHDSGRCALGAQE